MIGMHMRFARYVGVGAVATGVHYAVLAAAVELGHWPAWLASGFGAVVGAQVAFIGNRSFTFAHRGGVCDAWLKFMGTALAGALLGMAIVALGVALGWHYLAAQALATLCALVLTYAVNRAWTFR